MSFADDSQRSIARYINENFLFESDESHVPLKDSLFESGLLDSAFMVEIILFLEQTFDVKIPATDIIPQNFDTIERIAAYLHRAGAIEHPPAS